MQLWGLLSFNDRPPETSDIRNLAAAKAYYKAKLADMRMDDISRLFTKIEESLFRVDEVRNKKAS